MGSKPTIPESVKQMSTKKDAEFSVHIVYCMIYPNGKVTGEQTPNVSGYFEIEVTKDGKKQVIHSKKNGDGIFNEKSCQPILDKLKNYVEA
ncbi:unnamed protein product [Paramecium pentaurelia]|uniref:Selenoprotein W n=1 Tax=Paramecium pentaurelia TaxID=43138 RepID=A0A8S1VJW7_9CILI|nr:unnamed protein product [Paramecium pentaurelia]